MALQRSASGINDANIREITLNIDLLKAKAAAAQAALSVEERIALARDEGGRLMGGDQGGVDPQLRQHILNIIALDAEVRVRQALADTLASNEVGPRDIVLKLARDVDLVAVPLLSVSKIITEADLIAIVKDQGSPAKMMAIADRKEISADLSDVLIDRGDADTVVRVIRNPGASLSEPGLIRAVDRYGERQDLQSSLIERSQLPATVIERVVRLVADDMLSRLAERHEIPLAVASRITSEVKERAALGLTAGLTPEAMSMFIEQLEANGGITYSLLVRSLCVGNFEFIAQLIAMRCQLSDSYVRERLRQVNPPEIQALWSRSRLPDNLRNLAVGMMEVLVQSQKECAKWDDTEYRTRIIERTLMVCAKVGAKFAEDDIEFILDSRFAAEAAQ